MGNKTGFQYIDLNSPLVSEVFRPTPASRPFETYVATFNTSSDRRGGGVEDVYKLIPDTRNNPNGKFRMNVNEEVQCLRVVKGDVVESMYSLYGSRVEEAESETE